MKRIKRLFALLMTLAMVFGSLPASVFAADEATRQAEGSQAVMLVLDCSSEMQGGRLDVLKSSVSQFCEKVLAQKPDTMIGIVRCEWGSALTVADPTNDLAMLQEKINNLNYGGGVDLYDGLTKANEALQSTDMQDKAIVIMSASHSQDLEYLDEEGPYTQEDTPGYRYWQEANAVYNLAQTLPYHIYTIGVKSYFDDHLGGWQENFLKYVMIDLQNIGYTWAETEEEWVTAFNAAANAVLGDGGIIDNEDNRLTFGTDTWGFKNFGDTKDSIWWGEVDKSHKDFITDEDKGALLQGLSPSVRLYVQERINESGSGGHCYGIATTTILDKMRVININDYGVEGTLGAVKEVNDSLHTKLCYYQLLQFLPPVKMDVQRFQHQSSLEQLQEIIRETKQVKYGQAPVEVEFGEDNWGAHAVVAYDVKHGNYTSSSGFTYDSRILIYDSNYPENDPANDTEMSILYNDGTDQWEIPKYLDEGLTYKNPHAYLKRSANQISELDVKNYEAASEAYQNELIIRDEINADLKQGLIETIWQINGPLGYSGELQHYHDTETIDEGFMPALHIVLPDDNAPYSLTTQRGQAETLDYAIQYADSYQSVTADAAVSTDFDPSGKATITGNAGDFELTIADDALNGDTFDTFTISGDNPGNYAVETQESGAIITGDDLHNLLITADGADTKKQIAVNTDETTVRVDEKDGDIAVYADADGDGTYKNEIAVSDDDAYPGGYPLGDIDESLTINAADALQALRHSVKEIELTDTAFTRGNVAKAGNGKEEAIDASDALDILRFSVKEIDHFE